MITNIDAPVIHTCKYERLQILVRRIMAGVAQPHEKTEQIDLLGEIKGSDWWLNYLYNTLTAGKTE